MEVSSSLIVYNIERHYQVISYLTSFVFLLGVGGDERGRIVSLLSLVDAQHLGNELLLEVYQVVRLVVHVHGDHKRSIEMSVAENLDEVGVRVSGKLVPLALQQQNLDA